MGHPTLSSHEAVGQGHPLVFQLRSPGGEARRSEWLQPTHFVLRWPVPTTTGPGRVSSLRPFTRYTLTKLAQVLQDGPGSLLPTSF